MDKNKSPVGWYVGSYLSRFIEVNSSINEESEARFNSWENTVLIKADTIEEAFMKIEKIGMEHSDPFIGAETGAMVQWEYLGITELVPIYEELEDGSEIMWRSYGPKKLKNLLTTVGDVRAFKAK